MTSRTFVEAKVLPTCCRKGDRPKGDAEVVETRDMVVRQGPAHSARLVSLPEKPGSGGFRVALVEFTRPWMLGWVIIVVCSSINVGIETTHWSR